MKLLFTQDALVNAGAERSHLEILSRFSDQVDVSLVYFYPKHDLKEEYKKAGIRLVFLNIPESYHFGKAIFRLVKLIRAEKPDLLVSSLWRADIITRIASIITGVPLIGTLVNDSYSPMAWKDKKGLKYKVVHWLDRLTAGIPKHWIANAQALADSHVKTLWLEPKKISVVYRGRSVPVIAPARRGDSERTKRSINKEKDCFVPRNDGYRFLSYGRLLERKGFQDAIQAFELVNKKYPNSSFTIYGEGPYRSNLESLITKLGLTDCVKLPGKFEGSTTPLSPNLSSPNLLISNPPNLSSLYPLNLLLSSDCFLFPSWYEGFSGALVEAMMAGVPIIASDISMNLEAITDRQNAVVFSVKNIDSLTSQMQFAIENPELMEEFGQNARMTAVQRFDIEKIAKEYEGVLLEVFKRSVNHA
ncbi:glycosyltransferase family 4 protein [Algoriphagus aquimarinus]|uniref:Glycosyltransferase involved in cell wall bisynthesis n=1 Tax=Algoriphagus aquimarinus TaxID=237018 RepID=A0A1I1CHS9_9BACT|nr:glycosyltransferase family 4 protein [Algoriphagus aquimarinus]SFB60003.1 Glycosyltransferase involved in cell wall bisynthesis [Algoriphagus aquimarinus]